MSDSNFPTVRPHVADDVYDEWTATLERVAEMAERNAKEGPANDRIYWREIAKSNRRQAADRRENLAVHREMN